MLHADNAEIVKATAGVVIDNITDITKVFYPKMFANNPDLLNVFNAANQAIGEQPVALASSIVAYAHHLLGDSDIDFDHVLSRIAHKHVALAIAPGDYTIVGRNLMEAIAEVLGDAVTPDVARAWEEVYWLFAMDLATAEARLYQQIDRTPTTLLKDHRITAIDEVGGNARTFTLQAVDDTPVPDYIPGQYVSLVAQLREDYRQPRQYTISAAPGDAALQITVKHVIGKNGHPDGAVSSYLFERRVGDVVPVSAPVGDIEVARPDHTRPLVMFSAGIGITPMAAILDAAAHERMGGRELMLVHADVEADSHPLREQVAENAATCGATLVTFYEKGGDGARTGRVEVGSLDLPENAEFYLCGSVPFMQVVRSGLLDRGVDPADISYEIFGPDLWLGGSASSQADDAELAAEDQRMA